MTFLMKNKKLFFSALIFIGALYFFWPYIQFFGTLASESYAEYRNRIPFNSVSWQNASKINSDNPIRLQMVDDLLTHYKLFGKTREELILMLGEPDNTAYFKEYDMVYWLGPERNWMSVDSEWLAIRLNAQKQVSDYQIVTD